MRSLKRVAFLPLFLCVLASGCRSDETPPGIFSGSADIGDVGHAGTATYDAAEDIYTVSASGTNMWFEEDAFHLVWRDAEGDVSVAAGVSLLGEGVDPHRKAGLIVRQSLEPDAAYADVVVHGDGLTSLQYREVKGGPTREIQAGARSPNRIRLVKEGDYVFMEVAAGREPLRYAGGSFRLKLTDPFLVGLAVCAHNNDVVEQAVFSNVEIRDSLPATDSEPAVESTLEIISVASLDRRIVHHAQEHFEAPNWSPDGSEILFNQDGRLYKIPAEGGTPLEIDTGVLDRLNNDHGISPDGTRIAISDQSQGSGESLIYTLPYSGGRTSRVTDMGPSYWHGWSPDGRTLAYVGLRNEEYDIYTIDVSGGRETRLTDAPGLDDGPDYSPDGRHIYFNSVRTGTMQIYRMDADGGNEEQLTFDDYNDWFPHPSPDGRWIAFLSYEPDVDGHPPNKDVMLRIMPTAGGEIQVMAKLFGGQGTFNVPSWSPDSQELAFVSYRLVSPVAGD
jgi:Tol biopolymer transport system component